jgi:hypothetical protein
MVPPGRYTARLTAGGTTVSKPFDLLMDPLVAAEGITIADLEAQYELELVVRATIAAAREVSSGVGALRESVTEAREDAGGATNPELATLAREIAQLSARLIDAGGSYPTPVLLSQLNYLLGMISRADQAPGRDAYERHEELRLEVEEAQEILRNLERRMRASA